MNLPIHFPTDADVIADDVARFRALSPEQQVRTLGEMFSVYCFLEKNSDRPEALAQLAQEAEDSYRKAVDEFVARHA
jgi:hypothetical protein